MGAHRSILAHSHDVHEPAVHNAKPAAPVRRVPPSARAFLNSSSSSRIGRFHACDPPQAHHRGAVVDPPRSASAPRSAPERPHAAPPLALTRPGGPSRVKGLTPSATGGSGGGGAVGSVTAPPLACCAGATHTRPRSAATRTEPAPTRAAARRRPPPAARSAAAAAAGDDGCSVARAPAACLTATPIHGGTCPRCAARRRKR
jgi:hypothetical protein